MTERASPASIGGENAAAAPLVGNVHSMTDHASRAVL